MTAASSTTMACARALVALGLGAVGLAGCADVGEPYLGEGVGGPTTTTDEAVDSVEPETREVESAEISPVFTPARPDGYEPLLLVTTADSVVTIGDDEVRYGPLFDAAPMERVVDDYFGGLVAQLDGDIIQWLPANTEQPTLVSRDAGSLLGIGFLDGTLTANAFLAVPGGIDRVALVDGVRERFSELAADEEVIGFSASAGIIVAAITDDRCGEIRFYDAAGRQVDLGGPPTPPCPVPRRPRHGAVAISPDAGVVAYTEITYRGDGLPAATDLIVRELGGDQILLEKAIGGSGQQIDSLAFDGRRVAFLRTGDDGRMAVTVTVPDGAEEVLADLPGTQAVTFARVPLTLEPVVIAVTTTVPATEDESGSSTTSTEGEGS